MAQTKRAQPATHPTVYVGLALAALGLLLAIYAYTGTRIYDVRFAMVALGGALLAVAGIFVSAWGRAIVASRAQRTRRTLIHDDALKANDAMADAPPTVAAPASKKSFDFTKGARKLLQRKEKPAEAEKPTGKGAFAFKRRAETPPPPAPPEEPPAAPAPVAAPVVEDAPAAAPAEPALERVTIRCPRCATESSFEGVRPFPIACPSCGLAGTV